MKTRTNYKMPVFFGWYAIGSNTQANRSPGVKKDHFSDKELSGSYDH